MFTYLPPQGNHTMSSANIMDSGSHSLTPSVSPSMSIRYSYGLKGDPRCNPTSTLNLLLSPPATRAPWFGNLSTMSCISSTYFSGTFHSLLHLQISSIGTLLFAWGWRSHQLCFFFVRIQTSFHEFPGIPAVGNGRPILSSWSHFLRHVSMDFVTSYHLVLVWKVAAWTFSLPWPT